MPKKYGNPVPKLISTPEDKHVSRLLCAFREKLIDLSKNNRLINFRHSESSNTHLRIVNCGLNELISELNGGRQLEFAALPHPTRDLDDEDSSRFKAAYESAALSDPEYLKQAQRLNLEGSNEPETFAEVERSLKDRVRTQLVLPARQSSESASITAVARAAGIDPAYHLELDSNRTSQNQFPQIQTLFFSERMEAKLGKISDSARRSIEESGVNRLYLALGWPSFGLTRDVGPGMRATRVTVCGL